MQIPAGIQQTNRRFEEFVAKGDLSDLSEVYAVNARILPPGSPMIEGLEKIQEFWEGAIAAMGVRFVSLATVDIEVAGDLAVEIGTASLVPDAPGAPTTVKYVVKWKKLGENWRWEVDIWN